MRTKLVIIGANSGIAQEVAKLYAPTSDLFLVSRNQKKLETFAADLRVRGQGKVITFALDLNETDKHDDLLQRSLKELDGINIVLIAHGTLSDQKRCEASYLETYNEFSTNCLSVISLLGLFANYFEPRQHGTIAVISSVAGDRGRQSNYAYGAAKGGLTIFLQGLRNRLRKSNVTVLTIKPGFVDTPMIAHLKKSPLWASPNYVAAKIVKAIDKKRSVIYVPFFWRYIMFIIRAIPENLFCRLSL